MVREQELDRLFVALSRAVEDEQTVTVLAYGEMGMGKTTLLRSFAQATSPNVLVVSASFTDQATLVPLQPVAECVAQILYAATRRGSTADRIASVLGPSDTNGIDALVQLLGRARWTTESQEMFWAIRRFFVQAASGRPLALLLDDVHEGDAYTAEFLSYLGLRYVGPLLVVCTAEPSVSESFLPGPTWETILLHPLSPEQSSEIARDYALVGPEITEKLVRVAGGHPLTLVEGMSFLMKKAIDKELVPTTQVSSIIDGGFDSLIEAKLDQLDPAAAQVALVLAVASQPLGNQDLQSFLPKTDDLEPVVQSLLEVGILDFAPGDRYRIRHDAIKHRVYERGDSQDLVALHVAFADSASRLTDRSRIDEFTAHHLTLAVTQLGGQADGSMTPLFARAASAHLEIGQDLLARLDTIVATKHFELSRDLAADPEIAGRSVIGLITSLMEYGHYGPALGEIDHALGQSALAPFHDRLHIARIALHSAGNAPMDLEEAKAKLRELIARLVSAGDRPSEGYGWDALAYIHFMALEGEALTHAWSRALKLATEFGDRFLVGRSMFHLVQALAYGPTPVEEAIPRALELVDRSPSLRIEGAGLMSLATLYAMEGNREEAEPSFLRAAEIFFELNVPYSVGIGACGVYLTMDDPRPPLEYLYADYRRYSSPAYDWLRSRICGALAIVLWEVQDHEEATSFAKEARRLSMGRDPHAELFWRAVIAKATAAAGDTENAFRHEGNLLNLLGDCDFLGERSTLLLQLAEMRLLLGDKEQAAGYAAQALELAARKGIHVAPSKLRELRDELAVE